MVWNKRMVGILIVAIVLMLLAAVKCTVDRPKPVETQTYVDESGTVVSYEHYDMRDGQKLDTKSYALIMVASVVQLAIAYNFQRRTNRLTALKNRCTAAVSAVVTKVRSGRSDGHIRYRVTVYNATYRYEYLGLSYESNNSSYGKKRNVLGAPVHVGDTVEIYIDPTDPDKLFDFLAEDSLKDSRVLSVSLTISGILFLLVLLIR